MAEHDDGEKKKDREEKRRKRRLTRKRIGVIKATGRRLEKFAGDVKQKRKRKKAQGTSNKATRVGNREDRKAGRKVGGTTIKANRETILEKRRKRLQPIASGNYQDRSVRKKRAKRVVKRLDKREEGRHNRKVGRMAKKTAAKDQTKNESTSMVGGCPGGVCKAPEKK